MVTPQQARAHAPGLAQLRLGPQVCAELPRAGQAPGGRPWMPVGGCSPLLPTHSCATQAPGGGVPDLRSLMWTDSELRLHLPVHGWKAACYVRVSRQPCRHPEVLGL